ncbi:MAG: HAD family hydrolase [Bacillales bacterium]|jgi:Cof subfamily protein (haloacid dehalogenase superfamily)|nr:HAD family hydrolase [Bacillales bacterium]
MKILATDLDGTLLYPKRLFSLVYKPNLKFIRKWNEAGNKVILISSRGNIFIEKVIKQLNFPCSYVAYNGAKVSCPDFIRTTSVNKEKMKEIFAYCEGLSQRINAITYFEDGVYTFWSQKIDFVTYIIVKSLKIFMGRRYEKVEVRGFKKKLASNMEIYKSVFIFSNKSLAKEKFYNYLKDNYSAYFEIQNLNHGVEIIPQNLNKGKRLLEIVDFYKYNHNDVYCVGDDLNDLSMLELFENSFAMAQGSPLLKSKAKHIIKAVKDIGKYMEEEK